MVLWRRGSERVCVCLEENCVLCEGVGVRERGRSMGEEERRGGKGVVEEVVVKEEQRLKRAREEEGGFVPVEKRACDESKKKEKEKMKDVEEEIETEEGGRGEEDAWNGTVEDRAANRKKGLMYMYTPRRIDVKVLSSSSTPARACCASA